jgi:signal transduction histidine kinase
MTTLPRWLRDRRVALVVLGGMFATVVAVYLVVVLGGGALIGQTDSPNIGLSVLATAIVALGFEPTRSWWERLAGRWFHRGRQSPYDVLSRFTESVVSDSARSDANGPAAPDLPTRMAQLLAEGTGAQWTEVWLVVNHEQQLAATWPPEHTGNAALPPRFGQAVEGALTQDVVFDGEQLGVLRLQPSDGDVLGPVEQRLFVGLAAQSGPVLHRARLRADLARRADDLAARAEELQSSRQRLVDTHDAERRRLERDIHDGAQQHLVALVVNLRLAQTLATKAPDRARGVLEEQVGAVDNAIATLVDLSGALYPQALSDRGVAAALDSVLASVLGAGVVPVRVVDHGVGRHPETIEAALYFCAVEAVQNAVKHASATEVTVELSAEGDRVTLVVRDDGVGFDDATVSAGTGLGNMKDRVDAVDGALTVRSRPGDGTEVSISVPTRVAERTA